MADKILIDLLMPGTYVTIALHGSPKMIVEKTQGQNVHCVYIGKNGDVVKGKFKSFILHKVS